MTQIVRFLLAVAFVSTAACSMRAKKETRGHEPAAAETAVGTPAETSANENAGTPPPPAAEAIRTIPDTMKAPLPDEAAPAPLAGDEMTIVLKNASGRAVKPADARREISPREEADATAEPAAATASAPVTPARAETHARIDGVPAPKALGWLKNGNLRFAKNRLRKDGQSLKDVRRLATTQRPHAIVLSCSDSRVPPELIFDQKLGEIFVVRSAGPNLGTAAIASIEYAIANLGSRLLVVMGHTSCGAVDAALKTLNRKPDLGTPALNALVAAMHPRLQHFADHAPSKNLEDEAWANVEGVTSELQAKSDLVREALADGSLEIHAAVYKTDSGTVTFR